MTPQEALAEYRRLQATDQDAAERFAAIRRYEIIVATERELKQAAHDAATAATADEFTKAYKAWETYRAQNRRIIAAWEKTSKPRSHWHKSQRISSI